MSTDELPPRFTDRPTCSVEECGAPIVSKVGTFGSDPPVCANCLMGDGPTEGGE